MQIYINKESHKKILAHMTLIHIVLKYLHFVIAFLCNKNFNNK